MFWQRTKSGPSTGTILQEADDARTDARANGRSSDTRLNDLEESHERLRRLATPLLDTFVRVKEEVR